jgi:hypothetical protein
MKKIITLLILSFGASTAWAQQFDTTGINSWNRLYNSYETWTTGAFDANRDTSNPSDFGWGDYNITSHLIEGDSVYIIKTHDGEFKAISIDRLASGVFTLTHSNLNGSARVTKNLDRSLYDSKNFFYYSLTNDMVKDLEPASDAWDVVFSKYLIFFPGLGGYGVAGALHNRGVRVAQVEKNVGGVAALADTAAFPFSTNISTIGYDWKSAGPNGITLNDTLTYFVKDQNEVINELNFTDYGGSGTGKMVFTVNGVADSIVLGAGNIDQVYYSLNTRSQIATNVDNDWDIALFAQGSFSAIPVRINDVNGVELYVYPKSDISQWNAIGLEESTLNVLSIYPNPASEAFNIAHQSLGNSTINFSLLNLNGQTVKQRAENTSAGMAVSTFNITDVASGMYLLQVSVDQQLVATKRVVVQ